MFDGMRVLIVLFSLFLGTQACGMVTHALTAHRALDYYYQPHHHQEYIEIARSYPNAVLAGAPFPDYLYECGNVHQDGEDAHWSPFQAAAANYIREEYPKPYSEDARKLIAFMFGVVSHSIADIVWHGLGTPDGYGLIETIGGLDYNGTGYLDGIPHTMADTGGEFLAARQVDLSFLAPSQWYLPIHDIVEIYARLNDTVNATDIEKCQLIFATGTEAVKTLASIVTLHETDASPLFQEEYLGMPMGGVDDMAAWSGRYWERFSSWIEDGVPSPLPPFRESSRPKQSLAKVLSPIYTKAREVSDRISRLNSTRSSENIFACSFLREIQIASAEEDSKLVETLRLAGVTERSISVAYGYHCTPNWSEQTAVPSAANLHEKMTLSGDYDLSYFGNSVAVGDFNHDNIPDFIIGVPGTTPPDTAHPPLSVPQAGSLSLIWGHPSGPQRENLLGQTVFSRLGWSVAAGDLNCDGFDDFVASAPVTGWEWESIVDFGNFSYVGAVGVWFGGNNKTFTVVPDLWIRGDTLQFFGHVLKVGDIDGDGCVDLLIGSPHASSGNDREGVQAGRVDVFLSSSFIHPRQLSIHNADLSLVGSHQYERFGTSFEIVPCRNGADCMLLVGSPGAHCTLCDHFSPAGKLSGFSISSSNNANITASRVFELEGTVKKSKFGSAVAIGNPSQSAEGAKIVAVSAVSCSSGSGLFGNLTYGMVLLVDVTTLKGISSVDTATAIAVMHSGVSDSRFGSSLTFADVNKDGFDDLIVSSPLSSTLLHNDAGALWVYSNLNSVKGVVSNCENDAQFTANGQGGKGRFGSFVLVADVDSDGQPEIIVSSPREGSNMQGSVRAFGL